MDDLTGRTLASYEIAARVGAHGDVSLYRARQTGAAPRTVLLSVTPADFLPGDEFERRAEAASGLDHPHILPIYEHGTAGDLYYVAMVDIGVDTLRSMTARGPLPLPDVVDFTSQIAEALHYAHRHGITHGHLDAAAILIGAGKQCFLTGFAVPGPATVACVSPEQCRGQAADTRSDVYALGALVYEMLTAHPPFEADSDDAVRRLHVDAPPPAPRQANPSLPPAVDSVVRRALAKNPLDRFRSPVALGGALRSAIESFSVPHTTRGPIVQAIRPRNLPQNPVLEYAGDEPRGPALPPHRTPRWWPLLVLAVMLLLGIIVVALIFSGDNGANGAGGTVATPVPEEIVPGADSETGANAERARDFHASLINFAPPAAHMEVRPWIPAAL